ncbi:MAG: hypothetical protein EXQ85_04380 [Alphaproteobacteria bacterium]|nr:hypothetical protein [Alphaproteobacteria bacterium]
MDMKEQTQSRFAELQALCASLPPFRQVPATAWRVTQLPGLTNRSFRLQAPDYGHDIVLRLAGPGTAAFIARDAELHHASLAAAAGLAPAVLYGDATSGTLVTGFVADARPLTSADFADPTILEAIARHLRRVHDLADRFRGGLDPFVALDRYAAAAGNARIAAWRRAVEAIRRDLTHLREPAVAAHVDPVPANWLWSERRGITLIDWEFSALADPVWDLATLAVEGALDEAAETHLLAAYGHSDFRQRQRKLRLMKPIVSLLAIAWAQAALPPGPGRHILIARHRATLARHWPDHLRAPPDAP